MGPEPHRGRLTPPPGRWHVPSATGPLGVGEAGGGGLGGDGEEDPGVLLPHSTVFFTLGLRLQSAEEQVMSNNRTMNKGGKILFRGR